MKFLSILNLKMIFFEANNKQQIKLYKILSIFKFLFKFNEF